MKIRAAFVLLAVFAVGAILSGCGQKSVEGEWVRAQDAAILKIDPDWIRFEDGEDVRYEISGETALQLTKDGATTDLRWELDGKSLTLGDTIYYREGSKQADEARADACKSVREVVIDEGKTAIGNINGSSDALQKEIPRLLKSGVDLSEFKCPSNGSFKWDVNQGSLKGVSCSVHGESAATE